MMEGGYSTHHGPAINISSGGTVALQDIHFDNNGTTTSTYYADGIVYISSTSTATIDRCKFTNNSSPDNNSSNGSCIYTNGNLTLQNSLFYDNTCGYGTNDAYAAHVYLANDNGTTSSVINCTFTENNAGTPLVYYEGPSGCHTQKIIYSIIIQVQMMSVKCIVLQQCHR